MKEQNENSWPWLEELDAMKAAPRHHTLLMENEWVRVLDTCIPPGDTTDIHTHKWPAVLYVLSWSDFIRYDPEGNVLLDSRELAEQPRPSTAIWSDPLVRHYLKNTGNKDLHVLTVEMKDQ